MRGSHNFQDDEEFLRVARAAREMTVSELARFFRRGSAQQFAIRAGIDHRGHEYQQCIAIEQALRGIADVSTLITPPEPPAPVEPPECQCGIGEGLRWEKADRGEPVTWALQLGERQSMAALVLAAMGHGTAVWEDVCSIRFEQRSEHDTPEPDIMVRFGELERDAIAAAYMPRRGESMDASGRHPLCGDIVFNTLYQWHPQYHRNVTAHEIGHAIGHLHVDELDSLLYYLFNADIDRPSANDASRALVKYPIAA